MEKTGVMVIGAGVVGLTCAVALAESGADVTVVARQIPGHTSLAAGALWGPYLVEPKDRVRAWALESFSVLSTLADDPASTGVRMTAGVEASRRPGEPPDFTDMVPDVTVLGSADLPFGFVTGVRYTAPLIDMPVYLEYLRQRLHAADGHVEEGGFASLSGATERARVVINCSGIGARQLVPDDTVFPIRGQLVVVENPGLTEWFSEDTGESPELLHWYPHGDTVVLGGLAQSHEWETAPDLTAALAIRDRCAIVEPRLADARILEHRAGLRPTRSMIRLDGERAAEADIVHCYGHGGAGATLSWGCAAEVVRLAQRDIVS
jgi:D-amino-acid oxidase